MSSTTRRCLNTTQLFYESYDEHQFQPDTKLFHELVNIASSAYRHPYDMIQNAVHGSNQLYVLRNAPQNGSILCYSLIQFGKQITLLDYDKKIPVAYHNFIIINDKLKNTGLTLKLFEYFYRGMQERKRQQP